MHSPRYLPFLIKNIGCIFRVLINYPIMEPFHMSRNFPYVTLWNLYKETITGHKPFSFFAVNSQIGNAESKLSVLALVLDRKCFPNQAYLQ